MEVAAGTGAIETVRTFGDVQLHIEWQTPAIVRGNGQGRGNSGVFLMGLYEIQILDSYQNETYADGQAALYGVVVHTSQEMTGATAHMRPAVYEAHADRLPISLQDHGDRVRFRNIWVRELP